MERKHGSELSGERREQYSAATMPCSDPTDDAEGGGLVPSLLW